MLKIYKTSTVEKKTKKIKKITIDSWIELSSPTTDEIDKVVEKTKVDKDLILKMLDDEELPRVEQSGNATLVVIDTPYLEQKEDSHIYKTYPLGIIITDNNYVITVSPKKVSILNEFKQNKVKEFRTAKKVRFLIQILLRTSNYYLRALKQVNKDIEKKEKVLKKSTAIFIQTILLKTCRWIVTPCFAKSSLIIHKNLPCIIPQVLSQELFLLPVSFFDEFHQLKVRHLLL